MSQSYVTSILFFYICPQAAPLLIESIATFTCTEVCSYETFMLYAVCASVLALGRAQLKKEVVKNPQVIAVLRY
jgi:26S proteasome regulatory subunit N7